MLLFKKYPFEFELIHRNDPMIQEIYRLRYKVYVHEWGFERPEDHSGEKEIDEYDDYSIHFAAFRDEGSERPMIGTVRIILDSDMKFPLDRHCIINSELTRSMRATCGEISRLAVSKEYRRRVTDKVMFENHPYQVEPSTGIANDRRKNNDFAIVEGLYQCIYQESIRRGITHLYAVMARGLQLLLRRHGIAFQPAGPEVDYHGLRTPYVAGLDEIISPMARINPELFKEFNTGI